MTEEKKEAAPAETPARRAEQLKIRMNQVEDEIHSARGLNEQASVAAGETSRRIRGLEESAAEKTSELDTEMERLEGDALVECEKRSVLNGRVTAARAKLEATIARCAKQVEEKKAEQIEQEALLKSELVMYNKELESLRDFQRQRPRMEEELRQLDQALLLQRQNQSETMEQFEQQLKREKEQYERDIARRVRDVEQGAVNIKDRCLEETAMHCIRDTQMVNDLLQKHQFKSRDVLAANERFTEKIEDLKRENRELVNREKTLVSEAARHRQRLENLRARAAGRVKRDQEINMIETDTGSKIDALEQECEVIETENDALRKQIYYLTARTGGIDEELTQAGERPTRLMQLIKTAAPVVLESLTATAEEERPPEVEGLIAKLNETIASDPDGKPYQGPKIAKRRMISIPIQTQHPNMKFF